MPEQEVSVDFPTAGINVACEYARQPDGTTTSGSNVRAYDGDTERVRGASRPGITKLINATVNGTALVQHLAVLVDPSEDGLNYDDGYDENGDPLPGTVEDQSTNNLRLRNPGRRYRAGGGGNQPNRNRASRQQAITFVQAKRVQTGVIQSTTFDVVFDTQPLAGSLLVVVVRAINSVHSELPTTPTATNGSSGVYTNIGGSGYSADVVCGTAPFQEANNLSMFWRVASAGAPEQTVTVTHTNTSMYGYLIYEAIALEYRYANATSPKGTYDKYENSNTGTQLTVGPILGNGTSGQLCVGAFINPGTSFTSASGQNKRAGVSGAPIGANTAVVDKTNVAGVASTSLSVTAFAPVEACALICFFHK